MVRETEISERRACRLIGMHRWTFRYPGKPRDDRSLRERIRELAHRWPRFGYRRLIVLLRREGIEVNHKKAYRIYTEEDLKVRRKWKKIRSRVRTAPLPVPSKPNERWSMDFMQDCLADGRRFRVLTIVDDFTRECPAVEVDTSIPDSRVVRVLERHGIQISMDGKGRWMDNVFVERLWRSLKHEEVYLKAYESMAEAREQIGIWFDHYNRKRRHQGLNRQTPDQAYWSTLPREASVA